MPTLANTNLVLAGFLLGVIVILIVIIYSNSKKKSDEIDSLGVHHPSVTVSEQKYRDLFENANDAIFILDSDFNYKESCHFVHFVRKFEMTRGIGNRSIFT